MGRFTKESLELLRQKIDLPDLIGAHLDLKRAGASYKALCPFHEEKTPSFVVQKGDTHYHCFGCSAHGDAIAFLMEHLHMSFVEAVEYLAERYQVVLERGEQEEKGPDKALLKRVMERAARFYHTYLLNSEEGKEALAYLQSRHIDRRFVEKFGLGLAPKEDGNLLKLMRDEKIADSILEEVGLLRANKREFFYERILFPIRNRMGEVIGFSGRKYREETFGGKYVNTPETPLFKKNRVLFGLSDSRKRIAKERRAIVVEGQIDALRLIDAGLNVAVAAQGTAFGSGHVEELLHLGVQEVYLAFDGDNAGMEAAYKVGDLFQKEGIATFVILLPEGKDPDALIATGGVSAFLPYLQKKQEYVTFITHYLKKKFPFDTPAGKAQCVEAIRKQITAWENPILVHESLKKLAALVEIPTSTLDIPKAPLLLRKEKLSDTEVCFDSILEGDLLRLLLRAGDKREEFLQLAKRNVKPEDLYVKQCRMLYKAILDEGTTDLLALGHHLDNEGAEFLKEIASRKVDLIRKKERFIETLERILKRNWLQKKEEIRQQIATVIDEDQAIQLAQSYQLVNSKLPQVEL